MGPGTNERDEGNGMDLKIAGRKAFVGASTSGLGRASAAALAEAGAVVGINGRTAESVAEVAREIPGSIALPGNLVDPGERAELLKAIRESLGEVDILVLNGPGPAPGLATDFTAELAREAGERLLVPHVDLVRAFLPGMRERGWGRIVLIGSSAVQAPSPNLVGSSAGRSAVAAYLKTLAAEVAADGVTVNAVLPGRIRTPRIEQLDQQNAERTGKSREDVLAESVASIPAGRLGEPEEFGAGVAFLCSGPAAYITGVALRVDGGMIPVL